MRAVVYDRYGPADVLEVREVPVPRPAPGEVLVRVAAAGLNPADWRLRSGQFRFALRLRFPFVPGADLAGVVEAVGDGVDDVRSGQPVMAMQATRTGGACAEYAAVPREHLAPAPAGVPLLEAAGVPLCGSTALQALRDRAGLRAGLRAGQRLLVHGAAGGVGSLAVQVGRALGATVTAAASRDAAALLRDLGAEEVLDRGTVDLTRPPERLREAFDVVLDAANALSFRHARALLTPGGTAVSVNPFAERLSPGLLAPLRGGRRLRSVLVAPRAADLAVLSGWLAEGTVRPVVQRTLPLVEVRAAHRQLEAGHARGKTVLVVDPVLAGLVPGREVPA
ncbi:NADP-dependent oxidoreductase [Geodermatophilus sp. DSM 44513]|uniref:NADP-dependent oxidoreductase n=1 Tax=Geodermatophilus sp. DSM 44513 TaxID=1528104 RepID=UPI001277E05A|nr:NADP-dependent oxidoreductase [Geodermatophilus sp. DSM 44513]WNV75023.1 NADP-dependent oxidoreductase [Geodermatophilus sp. DSM 44513]